MSNDQVSLDINRMLREFSYAHLSPSIYRVTDCLRSTNSKAYDPLIMSIGPFHHGKGHLQYKQKLKMRYLKQLVGESGVDEYVHAIRAKEQAARDCYAEEIALGSDEFVQMLLLDGIFIIQFLRHYDKVNTRKEESFEFSGFGNDASLILHDLMLIENQIPLLVIDVLFDLLKDHDGRDQQKFNDLIWPFLSIITSRQLEDQMPSDIKGDHLLGLVHYVTTFSFSETRCNSKEDNKNAEMENIYSASELEEAGVVFKKAEKGETTSWLDITFKNKTIYFPKLGISDVTESLFKNMIAYEHYLPNSKPRYITDYAFFLHFLIQSSKDAELLRRYGIISNWLGGDARVYEVIEGLGTNVQPSEKLSYLGVFLSVNDYCRHRRNRWVAVLWRNHFDNPWTAISLIVAGVLLSVAIMQVVYAMLAHHQDS